MDLKETSDLLVYISDSYPGRFDVTKGVIKTWQDNLSDQDFDGVMRRAKRHIANEPHPPTISVLKIKRHPFVE
jgi:hypothetical protein